MIFQIILKIFVFIRNTKQMGKKIKITEEQLKRLIVLKEGWGSYDTISGYEDELETAVKKLKKVTPDMYKNLSDEENMRVSKVLRPYEDNVYDYIMHWVESGDVDASDVAQLAHENEEEFGTEPQFVIFAIDDFCKVFGINDYDVEDQDEESELDNDGEMPTPPSEEETMNNQIYESIRNNFKRFL